MKKNSMLIWECELSVSQDFSYCFHCIENVHSSRSSLLWIDSLSPLWEPPVAQDTVIVSVSEQALPIPLLQEHNLPVFCGGGLVTKLCSIPATPWTVAHQTPLSTGFSRQEYWSGLLFCSPPHFQSFPQNFYCIGRKRFIKSFWFAKHYGWC